MSDLQALVDELREEIAWLKSELGIAREADLAHKLSTEYGIIPSAAKVLLCLYRARYAVSYCNLLDTIRPVTRRETETDDYNQAKVLVWRIRQALGKDAVITVKGFGVKLSPAAKARLERLIDDQRMLSAA